MVGSRLHFRCPACHRFNRLSACRLLDRPHCGHCNKRLKISGAPLHADDHELSVLLRKSPIPVMVHFCADSRSTSSALERTLEHLGRKHAGRLLIAKVDMERNPRAASHFGVKSTPKVLLFVDGEQVAREVDAHPFDYWHRLVKPFLEGA
jgi:thioredoxin 2